ncbi:MAG: FAD-binding protein, partial [Gemmatimonadetes bacterium]|nr:FAD-binding protein [Gemmatimonadota bacterium]
MSQIAQPDDATQLASIVEAAARTQTPLLTTAGDSKWDWGRGLADTVHNDRSLGHSTPTQLNLSALSGIVDYEPSELVLVVGAATPLAQIEPLLTEQGQHL